jgi:hypothetical protein
VLSGALQADPNPVGDGHPLRIVGPALETFLDQKFNVKKIILQRSGSAITFLVRYRY